MVEVSKLFKEEFISIWTDELVSKLCRNTFDQDVYYKFWFYIVETFGYYKGCWVYRYRVTVKLIIIFMTNGKI